MEEAKRQDATSSYGDDDMARSDQGHVLSLDSDDDLEFEEDDYDKIYNKHVSHLALACIGLLERQMNQQTSSFASEESETTAECRKGLAEFIAQMHKALEGWMRETADLADELIHGLDSLFNEYKDVKVMLIGTLEVLIENLQYVISGETGRLYTEYGVMAGIDAGIEELYSLIDMIREASKQNDDLNFDMFLPFDKIADVRSRMFSIIRKMFPDARHSLCDQLALSVAIRRRRLRRTFKDAERFKARIARGAWNQVDTNRAYPGRIIASETQPFCTLASLPHNIEGSTASAESVDTSNMLNVDIAYSGASIESAFPTKGMDSSERPPTCKYPPALHLPPDAEDGVCSYCAERTTPSYLSRNPQEWEFHVNKDVKPFVCLSEHCCSPVLFFASMERWIEHMNEMHSHEWTKGIHSASWICETGHDAIQFKDVESFREHMNDKNSHATSPDEHQLRILETEQWRYLPRDEYLCPLCDFTLDMPKQSISADATGENLYRPLHEHIAGHLKELAVLSLPSLDATKGPEILPDNYKALENRSRLRESKKEPCPWGYDQLVRNSPVSDVQRSYYISQEDDFLKRRESEPGHVAFPTRNSFDDEFRTCFSTLQVQVFSAYQT